MAQSKTTMTYTVLMFVTRKKGMTPYQFKEHFEEVHVPLIYQITGPHFPKHHNRSYIQRTPDNSANLSESDNSNAKWPATSILGPGLEPDFDAIAELVFNDEDRCKRFFEMIKEKDAHRALAADEELFMDRGKSKAVVLDQGIYNHNCAQPPLE